MFCDLPATNISPSSEKSRKRATDGSLVPFHLEKFSILLSNVSKIR